MYIYLVQFLKKLMQCNSTSKYKGRVLAIKIFLSARLSASAAAPKMFLLSKNGRAGKNHPLLSLISTMSPLWSGWVPKYAKLLNLIVVQFQMQWLHKYLALLPDIDPVLQQTCSRTKGGEGSSSLR